MALNSRSSTTERNIQRASRHFIWKSKSASKTIRSRITLSRAYQSCLACHLPLRNRPHVGIGTASHVSMRLVLVGDSFIPKGPWELLWLVQAHRPVFGSVKLAPIKYEKSFVPRHTKSNKGLFWKSSQLCIWFVNYATDKRCQLLRKR